MKNRSNALRIPRGLVRTFAWCTILAFISSICIEHGNAQSRDEFHRTLPVTLAAPVTLDINLPKGELRIFYSRDGQVSIEATAQAADGTRPSKSFLESTVSIEQDGNRIKIRHQSNPDYPEDGIRIVYRIDVPFRTEVSAVVNDGKQVITGIMGPVKATVHRGDIKATYVSSGVIAHTDTGNLDLEVIGQHAEAVTKSGSVSCVRVLQGVTAEVEDGDISLTVVGPSIATVKKGAGTIEVGGARGKLVATTNQGELRVKASPHDDWTLNSVTGTIRVQLPPGAPFNVDAETNSGEIVVRRTDIASTETDAHRLHEEANGGGKQVALHSETGKIMIE